MIKKRLIWDIETSYAKIQGLWRPGKQYVHPENVIEYPKIICISYKWEHEKEVHTLTWSKNQCDKQLIKKFIKVLNEASESILHNGDRFDLKQLRGRALYHGIDMKPYYKTLDTLKLAKSQFGLHSYKLNEIARYLGLGKKLETGGFKLWTDVIEERCPDALEKMVKYCEQDVLLLEKVFHRLRPYTTHKQHYGETKFHCPECSFLPNWNKTYKTSAGTIQHYMKCKNKACHTYFKINNKTYQDYLQYKLVNGIK